MKPITESRSLTGGSRPAPRSRPRAARGSAPWSRPGAGSRCRACGRPGPAGCRGGGRSRRTSRPRPRRRRGRPRRARPGRASRRVLEQHGPAGESSIIGAIRLEPQRSCSLDRRGGRRCPARRRRSPCARPRGRRRGRGRRARPGRGSARAPGARSPARGSRGARLRRMSAATASVRPIAASTRQSSNGSRASGSRRRTSGSTAIASASFSGPRTQRYLRRPAPGRAPAWARRRPAISPSAPRDRRGPVRRPVDQQPVAQRHPAEPEGLLGCVSSLAVPGSAAGAQ